VDYQKINDYSIAERGWQKWFEFCNYNNQERELPIIYVDLECVLRKSELNKEDASSYVYQQYEEFSI